MVLDDPLSGPAALWAYTCSSKKNLRQFVGEGLLFKVAGRCFEQATAAQVSMQVTRLLVPDGEIRLDMKALSGVPRAALRLWVRNKPASDEDYYFIEIQPGVGRAALRKSATVYTDPAAEHPDIRAMFVSARVYTDLAERADLAAMFVPDGWNTVAVRMQGPKLWLLVNDQVALSAVDATHTTGEVYLGLARLGTLDDTTETAMLLRNLHVSRLAQVEEGRGPTYLQPPTPGAVIAQDALTGSGILTTGACTSGKGRTNFVSEGFEMVTTGRCQDTDTFAGISSPLLKGLKLPDGEVRFDLKIGGDIDRGLLRFFFRTDADGRNGYSVNIVPGQGYAGLHRWTDNQGTTLTSRADLVWLFQRTDWNALTVRVRGDQLWVLLNEQTVLFVTDATHNTGGTQFDLTRLGNPDDQQEVKVVVRNLRVSALAD